MTVENNKRLKNALVAVYASEEFKALKNLVIELKESDGEGGYYAIHPDVEREIDYMAITAGWIQDQLGGLPKRGAGKVEKIRKALGYTYPKY